MGVSLWVKILNFENKHVLKASYIIVIDKRVLKASYTLALVQPISDVDQMGYMIKGVLRGWIKYSEPFKNRKDIYWKEVSLVFEILFDMFNNFRRYSITGATNK